VCACLADPRLGGDLHERLVSSVQLHNFGLVAHRGFSWPAKHLTFGLRLILLHLCYRSERSQDCVSCRRRHVELPELGLGDFDLARRQLLDSYADVMNVAPKPIEFGDY
jgi:hypothetical protein